jgi:hypothetical protein
MVQWRWQPLGRTSTLAVQVVGAVVVLPVLQLQEFSLLDVLLVSHFYSLFLVMFVIAVVRIIGFYCSVEISNLVEIGRQAGYLVVERGRTYLQGGKRRMYLVT